MAAPDDPLTSELQSPLRPLGYFLWGVGFLVIGGMLAAVPPLIFFARLAGTVSYVPPSFGELSLGWLVIVPVGAWLFIVIPFLALSQAGLAFVASALAMLPHYERMQLVEFTPPSGTKRLMEARADIAALQVLSAASWVGQIPGWQFAISAMVLTTGIGLVLTVPSVGGAIAGLMLTLVGAGGSLVGIRNRMNVELKKRAPKRKRRKTSS